MIIGGKGRTNGGQLGAYLGDYLEHEKNDRVEVLEIRGSAFRDLHRSLASWEAEAEGTRCRKPLWHAHMRTPHGEKLTREQQLEAVNILERHLRFEDQPRAVVIHEKDGHEHIHIAWSRIDRKTGKAKRDNFTKMKNVNAAREIEKRFGLQVVDSPSFEKVGTRAERREQSKKAPTQHDYDKAKHSGFDPKERKATLTRLSQQTDSGKALRSAMDEAGYILARGDSRNFVVVDRAGDIHSLARQITGALKKDVDERLKDLDPASVPKAEHIRQQLRHAKAEREAELNSAGLAAFLKNHPRLGRNGPQLVGHERSGDQAAADGLDIAPPPADPPWAIPPDATSLDPDKILAVITQQKSTFTKGDLRYTVGKRLEREYGAADEAAVATIIRAMEKLPEFVELGEDRVGRKRYISRDMLTTELAMRDSSDRLAARKRHLVFDEIRDAAPSAAKLGEEQRLAFNHVTSDAGLSIVIGYAGTGKSTMLGAAREAWEAGGYRVRGLALAGMAAQSLQDGSNIESRTLASQFAALDKLPDQKARLALMDAELRQAAADPRLSRRQLSYMKTRRDLFAAQIGAIEFTSRDVIVLDEAGMVGSRQMKQLLEAADKAGAKVVMVGDAEQLQAIDAGGAFRALTERHGAVKITQVRRQIHDWAKQATVDFGDGFTREALDAYAERNHIHSTETNEQARTKVIEDWIASRASNPNDKHLMLAFTKADVAALGAAARQAYRDEGRLGIDETIHTDSGHKEFARGDRFFFLQNDTRLKVRNGSLGTVENIQRDTMTNSHRLTVKLDSDETVQFSTADYKKFDHGYASVIHKAQGATAMRAHVLASKYMDRHAAHVALTRHMEQADLYYSAEEFGDYRGLLWKLCRDGRKDTGLDYIHRAESEGRADTFWSKVNRVVEVLTKEDKRRRAIERFAEAIRLRTDPATKAERDLQRETAIAAAKLRDILGE